MNMEAQKLNTPEPVQSQKNGESMTPAIGDEVITKDKKGKSITAELISVNGNKAVVGYYDDRRLWVEIPKKLSEVTFVAAPTKTERPVFIQAEATPVDLETDKVKTVSEAPQIVQEMPASAQMSGSVAIAVAPEVVTLAPEETRFDPLSVRSDMVAWLDKRAYNESDKRSVLNQIDAAIKRYKSDPQQQARQLKNITERVKNIWEKENEKPLLSADEIQVQIDQVTAFLKESRHVAHIEQKDINLLLDIKKKFIQLHKQIQVVDEPNPQVADVLHRQIILRKYTEEAERTITRFILVKASLETEMKVPEGVIPVVSEPVTPVITLEKPITQTDEGVESVQVEENGEADITAEEKIPDTVSTVSPLRRTPDQQVIAPTTLEAPEQFGEVLVDADVTNRESVESPLELAAIETEIGVADQLLLRPNVSPETQRELAALATRLNELRAVFVVYGREPDPAIVLAKREQIKKPLAAIQVKLALLTESLSIQIEPMLLTPDKRVVPPSAPEIETAVPLSTSMPIPPGPDVQMIRTEDVPQSVNAPIPHNEKLVALRQAKDVYIQALTKAIQYKTLPRQGEQVKFSEGALLAVEAASDTYHSVLSTVQSHILHNVSEKFAIEKDAGVAKLERDFYDERSPLDDGRLKNVARILARGIFAGPEYAAKKLSNTVLRAQFGIDVGKREAEERNAERLRTSPVLPKPVVSLLGVRRPFSEQATEVPADREMSFNVPEPQSGISVAKSSAQYLGVEDVPDDERITFPDQKVIDLNMSDTELSDVVRPVGDTLQNGESRSIESVSTPESALTLETLYGFRDQFPGGREAFSDAVEKWAYGNEGAHAIPSAAQVRYFTNVHWVDPYQALSDHKKGKSVAEILAIHTSRAGSAHSLEDLKITREGFNVWANLLTQFKLNHPTVDIHALSFAEATDMLFAADRLTQSTNV